MVVEAYFFLPLNCNLLVDLVSLQGNFQFPKDYGASDSRKLDMATVQTHSDILIRYYPPLVLF